MNNDYQNNEVVELDDEALMNVDGGSGCGYQDCYRGWEYDHCSYEDWQRQHSKKFCVGGIVGGLLTDLLG